MKIKAQMMEKGKFAKNVDNNIVIIRKRKKEKREKEKKPNFW